MFQFIPLKGEHLEEVLFHAIRDASPSSIIEWDPNSHTVGRDITVDLFRISVKSCSLPKKETTPIEYSSFRTTSLKTIEEKVAYFDQSHYDTVVCLTRRESRESVHYSLREITHPFRFSEMEWSEDSVNFTGLHPKGKAVVRKSRSHQLLVFVPQTSTKVITSFDIIR